MKLKTRKGTAQKYMSVIQDLSTRKTSYTNARTIALYYNVGSQFIRLLIEKNIIIVDENDFYNWNKEIKPSIEIVNSVLKDISIQNKKYMKMRKDNQAKKQIQIQFSNSLSTDKPKVRRAKRKLQEPNIQLHSEQIGLIRKFIKFIW